MSLDFSFFKKRHIALLFTPLFLSACFGVEPGAVTPQNEMIPPKPSESKPIPPSLVPIASNKTARIIIADKTTHSDSLYSAVNHAGMALSLMDVTALSKECPTVTVISQSAMLYAYSTPTKPQVCFYKYTVSNKKTGAEEEKSSAYLYVRVTDDIKEKRPPLSLPNISIKNIASTPISIDVIAQLTALNVQVKGKTLNSDIIVLGSGTALASNESSFLFTPDATSKFSQILYTLTDSTNESNIEAGSIDIFIEQPNKTLPVAKNFTHDLTAMMGVDMDIDVAKYISDKDASPMTLSSVSVFNAFATLAPTCKTCFRFRANFEGQYNISYVISDQDNGYASGVATINVDKPWKDITDPINKKSFTATLSQNEGTNKNVVYSSHDDYLKNNQLKIPRYIHSVANAYCVSLGKRLPLKKELDDLYAQRGQSLYISDKWPVSTPYWISSDTKEAVSLENGALLTSTGDEFIPGKGKGAFVTCVQ